MQWGNDLTKPEMKYLSGRRRSEVSTAGLWRSTRCFPSVLHAFDAENNHFVLFQAMIDLGMLNCLRLRKRPSKKQYKRLNDSLLNSPSWPPLSRPLSSTSHSVIHVS